MKIKIDTDKLSLPGPRTGGVVQSPCIPPEVRDGAIQELTELGLDQRELARLLEGIPYAITTASLVDSWPTQGEDNQALLAVAELSEGLACVLAGLSPRAAAELATVGLQVFRDPNVGRSLTPMLKGLASGLEARVQKLPKQSRAKSKVGLVRLVYELNSACLGAPTKAPESGFYRACQQVFVLAGEFRKSRQGEVLPASPDRAIDALRNRIGR